MRGPNKSIETELNQLNNLKILLKIKTASFRQAPRPSVLNNTSPFLKIDFLISKNGLALLSLKPFLTLNQFYLFLQHSLSSHQFRSLSALLKENYNLAKGGTCKYCEVEVVLDTDWKLVAHMGIIHWLILKVVGLQLIPEYLKLLLASNRNNSDEKIVRSINIFFPKMSAEALRQLYKGLAPVLANSKIGASGNSQPNADRLNTYNELLEDEDCNDSSSSNNKVSSNTRFNNNRSIGSRKSSINNNISPGIKSRRHTNISSNNTISTGVKPGTRNKSLNSLTSQEIGTEKQGSKGQHFLSNKRSEHIIVKSGQKMDDRVEIEINEIIAGITAGLNVQKTPTIEVESLEELNFDNAERKNRIIQLAEALEDMKKTMTSEERNFFERLGSLEPIRGNLIFKLSCFIDTVLFPVPFVFFFLCDHISSRVV